MKVAIPFWIEMHDDRRREMDSGKQNWNQDFCCGINLWQLGERERSPNMQVRGAPVGKV